MSEGLAAQFDRQKRMIASRLTEMLAANKKAVLSPHTATSPESNKTIGNNQNSSSTDRYVMILTP